MSIAAAEHGSTEDFNRKVAGIHAAAEAGRRNVRAVLLEHKLDMAYITAEKDLLNPFTQSLESGAAFSLYRHMKELVSGKGALSEAVRHIIDTAPANVTPENPWTLSAILANGWQPNTDQKIPAERNALCKLLAKSDNPRLVSHTGQVKGADPESGAAAWAIQLKRAAESYNQAHAQVAR